MKWVVLNRTLSVCILHGLVKCLACFKQKFPNVGRGIFEDSNSISGIMMTITRMISLSMLENFKYFERKFVSCWFRNFELSSPDRRLNQLKFEHKFPLQKGGFIFIDIEFKGEIKCA